MRKKLLGFILAIALSLGCIGALVACGNSEEDAATADKVIQQLDLDYGENSSATTIHSDDYKVPGAVVISSKSHAVSWSVKSSYTGYASHVWVGSKQDNQVTIKIVPAEQVIDYTLTASVKVGKAKKSISFDRQIAKAVPEGDGTFDSPFSVAQAFKLVKDYENSMFYDGKTAGGVKATTADQALRVYVKGYVVDPGKSPENGGSYAGGVQYVYIVDDYSEEKDSYSDDALKVSSLKYNDHLAADNLLEKGEQIILSGFLEMYGGKASIHYLTAKGSISGNIFCEWRDSEGEMTPDEKVAAALADLKIKDVFSAATTTPYELPVKHDSTGATYSWALKTTGQNYVTLSGNKLTVASMPTEETDIELTVTVSLTGAQSIQDDITIKLVPSATTTHQGTQADPYTLADVQKIFKTLASGETYQVGGADKQVYIKGYVTDPGTINGTYGLKDTYIADSASADKEDSVLIYNINWGGALTKATTNPLRAGDEIVVYGFIMNHSDGGYEIGQSGSGSSATYPTVTTWNPRQLTAQDIAEEALDALTVPKTLSEDYTLPKVDGVTYNVQIESGKEGSIKFEDGTLKITKGATSVDVEIVITVTYDGYTTPQGKTFNVTVVSDNVKYKTGTLSFETADARTAFSTDAQVWEAQGIKFTNSKGSSTSNVVNNVNPVRLYKNSTIKIETKGMTKIVIVSESSDSNNNYLNSLTGTLDANSLTYTTSGTTVTITLSAPADEFELTLSVGQLRFYSIEVTYIDDGTGPSDDELITAAKEALSLEKTTFNTITEVPLKASHPNGAAYAWAVQGGNNENVSIDGNTLSILKLPTKEEGNKTFTLVVTITCGDGDPQTKDDITITIEPADEKAFTPITTPVAGEYYFAMQIGDEWYYMTGKKTGNYAAASTNKEDAALITLTAENDGWIMKHGNNFIEIVISGNYNNIYFNATRQSPTINWKWNAEYGVMTWTNANGEIWMGTYGTNRTFGGSLIKYLAQDGQYPGKLGTFGTTGGSDTPAPTTYTVEFKDGDSTLKTIAGYTESALLNSGDGFGAINTTKAYYEFKYWYVGTDSDANKVTGETAIEDIIAKISGFEGTTITLLAKYEQVEALPSANQTPSADSAIVIGTDGSSGGAWGDYVATNPANGLPTWVGKIKLGETVTVSGTQKSAGAALYNGIVAHVFYGLTLNGVNGGVCMSHLNGGARYDYWSVIKSAATYAADTEAEVKTLSTDCTVTVKWDWSKNANSIECTITYTKDSTTHSATYLYTGIDLTSHYTELSIGLGVDGACVNLTSLARTTTSDVNTISKNVVIGTSNDMGYTTNVAQHILAKGEKYVLTGTMTAGKANAWGYNVSFTGDEKLVDQWGNPKYVLRPDNCFNLPGDENDGEGWCNTSGKTIACGWTVGISSWLVWDKVDAEGNLPIDQLKESCSTTLTFDWTTETKIVVKMEFSDGSHATQWMQFEITATADSLADSYILNIGADHGVTTFTSVVYTPKA